MSQHDEREKHAGINPAARRDRPGEPHENLAERKPGEEDPAVKPHQSEPLAPLDPGGIGS